MSFHVVRSLWSGDRAIWQVLRRNVIGGENTVSPGPVTLDAARLSACQPGDATLRVTAIGRSPFLRTPPPEVRVRPVLLVR